MVPGAHEGRGLGNKFLDDLRHADALVHVVDASGTTDGMLFTIFDSTIMTFANHWGIIAEGKETRGYDPSQDIVWLLGEIVRWVSGNLMQKW